MNMYNQYGASGYQPLHKMTREAPKKGGVLKNKIGKWILITVAFVLLAIWFLLGSFRFMMPKFFSLTGFPFGTRNYLVLFQNNYELRPTGGFISSYGVLKFSHGIYKGIEFHDVYGDIDKHDYVEPPLVLATLLKGPGYEGHNFRDANYDPDFSKTKDELIKFYNMVYPKTRIDGVIAADFTFLERMVALYEPLTVENYKLTEGNLFETLSTVVSDIDRHNEEALAKRKNISGEIVKSIIKKTLIFPWRITGALDELAQAFDEKHMIASFNGSGLANAFAKRGWDGGLPGSNSGDFVAVVTANYGGMKSDRYITRDVTYDLNVTSEKDILGNPVVNAKVTIDIRHNGIWNIPLSGPYTGYLRTLIPLNSTVTAGATVKEDRADAYVLGELLNIPVGGNASYTYEYTLPEYVWNNGVYNLQLRKQPGTLADRYRVIVHVPQGESLDSNFFDIRENVGFFETNLISDQNLFFMVTPDTNPPRIVSHEITGLNEITIVFNEPIPTDFGGDALNYQVTDMDYADSETKDVIGIAKVRVEGSAIILTTAGMTIQEDERYEVAIRNLRDSAGNVITPNPRTVTVVQGAANLTASADNT